MTKKIEECFEKFWAVYPNRKSKGAARKAFEKAMKDVDPDELTKEMISAIDAQNRYRREAKSSGEFMPNWKHPGTWINAEAWLDEIPSHAEVKQRQAENICINEACDQPSMGSRIEWCEDHYPDTMGYKSILKDWLKKNGLWKRSDETIDQWQMRCKADSITKLRSMGMMKTAK